MSKYGAGLITTFLNLAQRLPEVLIVLALLFSTASGAEAAFNYKKYLPHERAQLLLSWGSDEKMHETEVDGEVRERKYAKARRRAKIDVSFDLSKGVGDGTGKVQVDTRLEEGYETLFSVARDLNDRSETVSVCKHEDKQIGSYEHDLVNQAIVEDKENPQQLIYHIYIQFYVTCTITSVSGYYQKFTHSFKMDGMPVFLHLQGRFPKNSQSVAISKDNITHISWPGNPVRSDTTKIKIEGSLAFLAPKKPAVMVVSPDVDFVASRPQRKSDFAPSKKVYKLRNTGEEDLDFAISSNRKWVKVAPAEGRLKPGKSTSIKLSLVTRKLEKLKTAKATAQVSFDNKTNSKGSTKRKIILATQEKWRVTYDGYRIFYHDFKDGVAGGVKVHYRTIVDFKLEGDTFKNGSGSNKISKVENYANPPGVWQCKSPRGYPDLKYKKFTVTGVKTGSTVKLNLPSDNTYLAGYDCLLQVEVLKDYLRSKGKTEFPSIDAMSRKKVESGLLGVMPYGLREVSLSNYSKQLEQDKFQGLHLKVKKIR